MVIKFDASKSLHGFGISVWVYDNRNASNTITYTNPNGVDKFTVRLLPGEINKYWEIENDILEAMMQHGRKENFWTMLGSMLNEKYTLLGDGNEMTKTEKLQITFEQAIGELKKYVGKKSGKINRPILQNIHFDGENFIATNSHILLTINKEVVKDIPTNIVEGSLINPKDGKLVNEDLGRYPDINKLIPTLSGLKLRFNDLHKEILKQVRAGNKLLTGKSDTKLYRFVVQDDYMNITAVKREMETEVKYEYIWRHNDVLESDKSQMDIHVNSGYLTTSLNTVFRLYKKSNGDMSLSFDGRFRPIVMRQEGVFNLIILPVRIVE